MSDTIPEAGHMTTGSMITRFRARLDDYKELKRFIKFAVVGGIGFVVDFSVSNLFWAIFRGLEVQPRIPLPLGLEPIGYVGIGGIFGFMAAITSNFIWNRYWTYPDSRSKAIVTQYLMFLLINLFGLIIRVPILENLSTPLSTLIGGLLPGLGVDYLAFVGPGVVLVLGKNAALIVSVTIAMFWNFFVNRYLTYGDVD
ncbi:MAG: GtrA family protein [Chloroflexi bacterium]|nr:GtrA family protein [Chloroflexota bacterium]